MMDNIAKQSVQDLLMYIGEDIGREGLKQTPDRVVKSIKTNGLRGYIIVRELGKDKYEVVDGEQRWRACKELGYTQISIYNEGEMTDKRAKELTIWYQVNVPFVPLDLAELVANMAGEFGLDKLETPYGMEELQEMVDLSNFDFDGPEDEDGDGDSKPEKPKYVICPNCKTKININDKDGEENNI